MYSFKNSELIQSFYIELFLWQNSKYEGFGQLQHIQVMCLP